MCAIWGIGVLNRSRVGLYPTLLGDLVRNLADAGKARGNRSTGIAVVHKGKTSILKGPVSVEKFLEHEKFKAFRRRFLIGPDFAKVTCILGHNRVPTKGTPENNNNNHPIVTGNVVGVHNGVIRNDDAVFKKFPNIKRVGEVDSEAIFAALRATRDTRGQFDMRAAAKELSGTFAAGFVDKRLAYQLNLFRNISPLAVRVFPKVGIVVFASTDAMLSEAADDLKIGYSKDINIAAYSGAVINLLTNKIYKVNIA